MTQLLENKQAIDDMSQQITENKKLLEKLLVDVAENKQEINILSAQLRENDKLAQKINKHVDFIENVYDNVKYPLNYVCDKINALNITSN